jgi:hypothetical protein
VIQRPGPSLRFVGLLALASSACSVLLDIDDAHVDPSLEGKSGSSSAAGKGSEPGPRSGSPAAGGNAGSSVGGSLQVAGSESEAEAGSPTSNGGSAPQEASLCERYCGAVLANCGGQLEQYRNLGQCLEVCERLPPGSPGDEGVNTVECRARQALFAESEPSFYCKSAGPLGEDRCGSNCVSYCSLMQASCTPASTAGNLEPSYYLDEAACLQACDAITPGPLDPKAYSSSPSATPSSYVGNNVYCRMYHVTAGLEQSAADEHCPHAMGGDPCTDQ